MLQLPAQPVRASYGVIKVLMQSSFLASFRSSSTFKLAGSSKIKPEGMSSRGGSRSLGEMECMQLLASGMTSTLSEFSILSDMRVINVCRLVCRCPQIICECEVDHIPVDRMRVPDRLLRLVVYNYLVYKKKLILH
jgi:hypothetical protein